MKALIACLEVVRLALKSIWRWRWRYATLAVLIGSAFTIFTLYASLLTVNGSQSLDKISTLRLPADFVVVASGERLNRSSGERYQPAQSWRASLTYGEEAVLLNVDTAFGKAKVLGVSPKTEIYSPNEIRLVAGEFLKDELDMVLPGKWAEEDGVALGTPILLTKTNPKTGVKTQLEFRVKGFYDRADDLSLPLVRMEDALALGGTTGGNCYLARMATGADFQQTFEWVRMLFPGDKVLSAVAGRQLGQKLVGQTHSSGWGLLLLIQLFAGVAILTITMMTFLERRRELAVLKALGAVNAQVAVMLAVELLGGAGLGLMMGSLAVRLLRSRMPWMSEIAAGALGGIEIGGSALGLAVVVLAAALPTLMAKVATVNELLFARVIPLRRRVTSQLEHTYSWVVEREQQEGVRLLRLDIMDGRFDGILMKAIGDRVKRGEVIASLESLFGLVRKQWASPADGCIRDYDPVSGYIAIKPDHAIATVGLQVQTFAAGPSVGLGGPRLAPRMVTAEKGVATELARADAVERHRPGSGSWWRKPAAITVAISAIIAPTAYLGLTSNPPQGLPITSYRPVTPLYPSYQEWSQELAQLAARYPELVQLTEIGKTYGGRPIFGLTITDRASGEESGKPGVFVMAAQHANEVLGSQVGLNAIRQLLAGFGSDTASTELLRQRVVYAVPLVNPDGYEIFTSITTTVRGNVRPTMDSDRDGRFDEDSIIMPPGAFLRSHVTFAQDWLLEHRDDPFAPGWSEHQTQVGSNYTQVHCPDGKLYAQVDQDGDGRKAEDGYDGIDLNRNWGTNWRLTGNYGVGDFGGEEPWSEAETQAVRNFILAHPNIQQALDLHSGEEAILFPQAFSGNKIPEFDRFVELGEHLRPDEWIKVQPYHKLYSQSGTAIDWFYEQGITPLVFEMYAARPKYQIQRDGTYVYDMSAGWIYNPATADDCNWVVRRWVPVIINWMAMDM